MGPTHSMASSKVHVSLSLFPEDLRSALKSLPPNKLVQRHITQTQRTLDKLRPRGLRQARLSRSQLQPVKQTQASYIGVHIRSNQPDKEPALTLPESAYTPEGWATIKQMRSLTRLELFIGEIKRLVEAVSNGTHMVLLCSSCLAGPLPLRRTLYNVLFRSDSANIRHSSSKPRPTNNLKDSAVRKSQGNLTTQ